MISISVPPQLYIPGIDVLSCEGGWCTRAQRHQRWRNGFACPQASFRRLLTTFLENIRGWLLRIDLASVKNGLAYW